MKYALISALIVLSVILSGCLQTQTPSVAPVVTNSGGSGAWSDFWLDRSINFPIINATANYTGNETSTAGFYGTIKLITVKDLGNSTANIVFKNEIGTQFANITATALSSTTNRTIAYENYGLVYMNVTCRSCTVRIVSKMT